MLSSLVFFSTMTIHCYRPYWLYCLFYRNAEKQIPSTTFNKSIGFTFSWKDIIGQGKSLVDTNVGLSSITITASPLHPWVAIKFPIFFFFFFLMALVLLWFYLSLLGGEMFTTFPSQRCPQTYSISEIHTLPTCICTSLTRI